MTEAHQLAPQLSYRMETYPMRQQSTIFQESQSNVASTPVLVGQSFFLSQELQTSSECAIILSNALAPLVGADYRNLLRLAICSL